MIYITLITTIHTQSKEVSKVNQDQAKWTNDQHTWHIFSFLQKDPIFIGENLSTYIKLNSQNILLRRWTREIYLLVEFYSCLDGCTADWTHLKIRSTLATSLWIKTETKVSLMSRSRRRLTFCFVGFTWWPQPKAMSLGLLRQIGHIC